MQVNENQLKEVVGGASTFSCPISSYGDFRANMWTVCRNCEFYSVEVEQHALFSSANPNEKPPMIREHFARCSKNPSYMARL